MQLQTNSITSHKWFRIKPLQYAEKSYWQHIYQQLLHHDFSLFSPPASVIRLTSLCLLFLIAEVLPLTRSSVAAEKDTAWSKVISRLTFPIHNFKKDTQKFKNSYHCSLIIHPYRSKPDQNTVTAAVLKAIKCGFAMFAWCISATYPDVNLTLHVRVAQRENVVPI